MLGTDGHFIVFRGDFDFIWSEVLNVKVDAEFFVIVDNNLKLKAS